MERFTISLDDKLARQFDTWCASHRYANRSEAVRDLLRAEIARTRLRSETKGACVACLSYVFNHHERELAELLTQLQHQHHQLTMSTMHVHLDHEHCLETVLLRGPAPAVIAFADRMMAERGVHHGHLNVISVDVHEPHRKPRGSGHAHSQGDSSHVHVHLKPSA